MVFERSASCMNSRSSSLRLRVVALSRPYMRPTNCKYSGALRRSKSPIPSGTTPIWRFNSTRFCTKSRPRREIRPALGARSPVSILMVVDLPAPFGPRKPKNCPDAPRPEKLSRILHHRRCCRNPLRFAGRKSRQYCGQFHAKHRATGLRVVTKNLPRVLLHDPKTDTQSQPGAFADRLGGVERVEHAMRFLQAWTSVGKQDRNVGAVA